MPELDRLPLRRSLPHRGAAKLLTLPLRSKVKKLALGAALSLAATPVLALADAGVATAAPGAAASAPAPAPKKATSASIGAGHPVRLLQSLLHVAVDGIFGPETLTAVKAYQSKHGLEVDGIVGPRTWASLGYSDVKEISALAWALPKQSNASEGASSSAGGSTSASDATASSAASTPSAETTPTAPIASSAATGSSFALCVANREAGSPGSTSSSTVNWTIQDAPYEGGFQWLNSTWIAQGGGRYAPRAVEASPSEQIAVFQAAEPSNPGAWPVTVPACGG